jgi:hypothetical protein
MNYFKELLSQYNPVPLLCYGKTLHALRAEFMVKKTTSKIDLEHYSVFFDKSIRNHIDNNGLGF